MSDLKKAISGLEAVALACETVTKSVTLAGTDMRDRAADIRAVVAQLASALTKTDELTLRVWKECKRAEAAEARVKELEVALAAIGDLAVADWDDATVGKVDAVVKEPTRYAARLRALFSAEDRLRAVTEALERIASEGEGALNNAFPEDAPDVVSVLTGYAILALRGLRSADLPPHPDTKRLDWLETQRGVSLYVHTTGQAKFRTNYQINEREVPPCHETVRAAIDAARAQAGKEAQS